jgi:hypothetical protein
MCSASGIRLATIRSAVRSRGGVEPELIVGALAREYRREFGADPGRMPLQAIVFSATKKIVTALSHGEPQAVIAFAVDT